MSSLAIRCLEGELLSPCETVRVVGRIHALSGALFDFDAPAGLSIDELLELALEARPALAGRRDYAIAINGDPILERNWRRVRVKPGVTVSIVPRLHGGSGGGLLKTVLSAVVVFAAILAAPYLAPALVSGLSALGITASLATATTLASAGLMLAGTLALNALFPVARSALSNDTGGGSSFNSIQGAQNQANPYGAVPVVLGRHRQSPFYAAKPYTEISGSDQYLRLLFVWGYGPLSIEDIRIGETPLSSFEGVTIETRQGFEADAPITLYPSSVDEIALSIELDAPQDAVFSPANPGPYSTQTTAAETDHISLDFTAVEGITGTDPQGADINFVVPIEVQYRIAGSSDAWSTPSSGAVLSRKSDRRNDPSYGVATVVFSRSFEPTRRGIVIDVPRGQYEVRCRRAVGKGYPPLTHDKIVWTALRSFKNEPPVNFPKPLALTAVRIKATDQLSGVINTLNGITTSLVKSYSGSGSTWNDDTASQNPADLFRHVLQGPANARAVADDLLDLDNLAELVDLLRRAGFRV
jgi:predicted phage tail protein